MDIILPALVQKIKPTIELHTWKNQLKVNRKMMKPRKRKKNLVKAIVS
jgi:hypothetical protein